MRSNLKAAMDDAERMPLDNEDDDFKDAGEEHECAPGGGVTAGLPLGRLLGEAAAKASSDAEKCSRKGRTDLILFFSPLFQNVFF